MKLLVARTVAPFKQNLVQPALAGCGRLAAFQIVGPRPDAFPRRVAKQDEWKVAEEFKLKFVIADEMVNSVLNFLNRKKRQLAVRRRVVEPMFEQFFVLRSLQEQRQLRASTFRRDFGGAAENPFAFLACRQQPFGWINLD